MDETRGITVKVPADLHGRARQEQESLALTMSNYITMILEEHFDNDRKGGSGMDKTKTLAFQVSEELFRRLKEHLARNPGMTQKSFVLSRIEQALTEAENAATE